MIDVRHVRGAVNSLSKRAGTLTLAIALAAILLAVASRLEGQGIPANPASSNGVAQVVEIRIGD